MELEYYAIRHCRLGYYTGDKERAFAPLEEQPRLYRSVKDASIQIEYIAKKGLDRWDMRVVSVLVAFPKEKR